jgi:4-amino-4-deoxy-L-arabinose transferase-like glycosyltransferase
MSQAAGAIALKIPATEQRTSTPSARLIVHLTWGFVGLGVLLRLARYLLRFPLWADECFVAINFIDGDFADMLRPLRYSMVCPLLVLWSQLGVVKLLGFSELTLRLPATLASIGSLLLFRYLSGRLLQGWAWLLAVGIFAVSYYPIRHGCEVKPYAMDLLVALVLLTLAVEWLLARDRARWWWLLAAVMPLALGFSYTATFVAGGISLALAPAVYQTRQRRIWAAFLVCNALLVASFLGWYLLVGRAQAEAYESAGYKIGWNGDFPPFNSVSAFATWFIDRHTGHMLAYPIGGGHGGSAATAALVALAVGVLWRQRRRALAAAFLAPLGFCFVAAVFHRYPYGGSQRTMQFMAPAFCIMAGLGLATVAAACARWRRARGLPALAAGILVAVGVVSLGRDLLRPYKTIGDFQTREFARWFWWEQAHDADVACCIRDLDLGLNEKYWRYSNVAVYLCNQAIYSRERRGAAAADAPAGTRNRRLRCINYGERLDNVPQFTQWLTGMQSRYQLRGMQEFRVNSGDNFYYEVFVVYELEPRPDAAIGPHSSTGRHTPATESGGKPSGSLR